MVGDRARLEVVAPNGILPTRWTLVDWRAVNAKGAPCPIRLIVYAEKDGGPVNLIDLKAQAEGWQLVRLPHKVDRIFLQGHNNAEWIRLERFQVRQISTPRALYRLARPRLSRRLVKPRHLKQLGKVFFWEGMNGVIARLAGPGGEASEATRYKTWIEQNERLSGTDRELIARRIAGMAVKPLISIVMPTYETPEPWLRRAIESVREQIYPHWELCIADDASPSPHVAAVVAEYQALDPRVKFVRRPANGHISAASNSALEMASGDFVALLDHDDEFSPLALYMVAEEINGHPDASLIYTDEDKIDESGTRFDPYFKPDWNPDLMLSHNMITHLAVFRRSVLVELGGFRSAYDGSQDYDLMLRMIERIGPQGIRHIPFILYHWRAIQGSTALAHGEKPYAHDLARKVIKEHLDRTGHAGASVRPALNYSLHRVTYPVPDPAPPVDIVIPTKDKVDLLRCCINSILEKTLYPNYRILIVDNRSEEEASRRYFAEVTADPRISVIKYDAPYNFAALNNWAVTQCDAPLLAFVNNDIEVISPEWLGEMVGHALRPEVGPVGAKLYYPDDTIQHAGVIVGLGGLAGHAHHLEPRNSAGYVGRAVLTQSFSAVTAACLVVRRELFEKVNGFDGEAFGIAYNDVDLCLRLGEQGYRSVWTPYAELYHHESASLGDPNSDKRREQFKREADAFRSRWAKVIAHDPAYNPNLTRTSGKFSLAAVPEVSRPWLASPAAPEAAGSGLEAAGVSRDVSTGAM
nr:glycosyltransferase family 2 protein [Azospirillum sp. 412522]